MQHCAPFADTTLLPPVATRSAVGALHDPERADLVASLGDTTGYAALVRMRELMLADEVGSEILRERPLITEETINMDGLRKLPAGTLGYAYVRFMDSRRFTPGLTPSLSVTHL